ncbi:DUF7263 family protein [Salinibaculum rarum]|uniref:DUF7263 family protein n=1 Tax=Salinibaculum rarum TaxID=3058903 RepID=UPI00265E7638|nr:hypothetical protein [Salinibaculum sp. KK48]
MRAQLSLPALGLAFLVLTSVAVLGVAVADTAAVSAERPALDRQATVALSDRLVSPDGPLAVRQNVLDASAVETLNRTTLHTTCGLRADVAAEVTLDGETLVATGDTDGGTSIERLVVVEQRRNRTLTPPFAGSNNVTLPRRTNRLDLAIRPSQNITISTARVGNRVVLHNESGLRGNFTVGVSRLETTRLSFESSARLSTGDVSLTYYPVESRKARLGVTVDG